MIYFCFSVAPKITHPQFCEIQAGWAHVVFLNASDDDQGESDARKILASLRFDVLELQGSREIPVEHLQRCDTDRGDNILLRLVGDVDSIRELLFSDGYYVELNCYKIDEGPMIPPVPGFLKKR